MNDDESTNELTNNNIVGKTGSMANNTESTNEPTHNINLDVKAGSLTNEVESTNEPANTLVDHQHAYNG